jgi:hypothetical protein
LSIPPHNIAQKQAQKNQTGKNKPKTREHENIRHEWLQKSAAHIFPRCTTLGCAKVHAHIWLPVIRPAEKFSTSTIVSS